MGNPDLDDLERRIAEARHGKNLAPDSPAKTNRYGGAQAATEFVASIVLSSFVGFKLDQWFGTMPLLVILLFLMGVCAGFLSLFRYTRNMGLAVGYSQLRGPEKTANKAPDNDLRAKAHDQKEE